MTTVISSPVPRLETPTLSQDDPLYEIIDGQRVELLPKSILANRVTIVESTRLLTRANPQIPQAHVVRLSA